MEIVLSKKEVTQYEQKLNEVFEGLKVKNENLKSQMSQVEIEMYRTQGAFRFLKTLLEDQARKAKGDESPPNILPLKPPDIPEKEKKVVNLKGD